MHIKDCLTELQVDRIISIIRSNCDIASRERARSIALVGKERYDRITKNRKTHNTTSDIYLAFFYPENRIEGLEVCEVQNGGYAQPELRSESAIIHIYHYTNPLNSGLVIEKKKDSERARKPFFCLRYKVNSSYRLELIESTCFYNGNCETESFYTAPKIIYAVG